MHRKPGWRNTVSDSVCWHQEQALNTNIFILKEFGPIGFLLKEDGEARNFKVFMGEPHTCTCSTFQKEKEPCKHICWVLLRKFRVPRDHEYCYQVGLGERQILEILQGFHKPAAPQPKSKSPPDSLTQSSDEEEWSIHQKDIGEDDVCPICQEELLSKRLPVTYCRFGCGNSVHISCMRILANHQIRADSEAMVKCPLCREDFIAKSLLLEQVRNASKLYTVSERERPDKHLGITCNSCRACPITGKCFKCTACSYYHLCEDCTKRDCHPQHSFVVRTCDTVPRHVLESLPTVKVRQGSKHLEPGQQCRMCLKCFSVGQYIRHLPCHHKFHKDCIDKWLHRFNFCPLDCHVFYNPLKWKATESKTANTQAPPTNPRIRSATQKQQDLFIPGTGLQERIVQGDNPPCMVRSKMSLPGNLIPPPLEPSVANTRDLCINSLQLKVSHGTSDSKKFVNRFRTAESIQRCPSMGQVTTTLASMKGEGAVKASGNMSSKRITDCIGENLVEISSIAGGTQQGLIVGLNSPDTNALPRVVAAPHRVRPLRKVKPREVRPSVGSGHTQNLDLLMMGIVINTTHRGKK
ncbi:E3 ubiquitin-protein ligase ZSWIM2 [Chanos chanos]|uniref:E3 ubiquitin-protein ligase ZSWIM2 n=1 Tax=Chanos chanos TaxID=29144 RepID=A0A6J2W0K5_CHACN|nr:E3 ubiquitin-protein ligase ZSWIM2 [Chanos chanos]